MALTLLVALIATLLILIIASADQTKTNVSPAPIISDDCRIACETAEKYEREGVMRHLSCAALRPLSQSERPVSPKLVKISCCRGFWKPFTAYYQTQQVFLAELLNDPQLRFSGVVMFQVSDNSTILAETGRALFNLGIPYLSHAHTISPIGINCSGHVVGKTCIYQPDFHFIGHKGWERLIRSFENDSLPFRNRKNVVYWRGSSTGLARTCEDLLRLRMCKVAEGTPWLDLKITNYIQICHGKPYIPGNRTKEEDWRLHRGIIDVDGNVNAWGLFWRLASGSVVFKTTSHFTNYYISQLRPWVHFVPLADDLSDLVTRTALVMDDNAVSMMEEIASNARNITMQITYSSEIIRMRSELNEFYDTRMEIRFLKET